MAEKRPTPATPAVPDTETPALDPLASNRRTRQARVIERRLKGDHLFTSPSEAIPLKDPTMRPRWFNRAISDDRFWVAEQQKGWIKVHRDDVASLDAISGYHMTPEGYITRGPRGEEMLYMMPRADFERLAQAKAAANVAGMASQQRRRDTIAEAAAAQFGEQAGEYLRRAPGGVESWRGPEG